MDHPEDISPEASGARSPETSPDTRLVTYAELGRIRGIGRESAVKLVQRKRWRRIPGNDGEARIAVPLDWLTVAKEPSGDQSPGHSPEPSPELSGAISVLEAAIAALRVQLDHANDQADRAENRAEAAVNRADRAERTVVDERKRADRADQSRDAERERADGLRDQVQDLVAQLATAGADAKAANDRAWASGEQLASVERRAEAERVRAERAESGAAHERQDFLDAESRMMREQEATRRRADQAEEGRDGERARADALRERLDAIQVQLAARQEVVAAAEAIREANDRRLALGRWARLRRAWRGV